MLEIGLWEVKHTLITESLAASPRHVTVPSSCNLCQLNVQANLVLRGDERLELYMALSTVDSRFKALVITKLALVSFMFRPILSRGETIDSCCSEDLVTVLEVNKKEEEKRPWKVITVITIMMR